MSKNDRFAGWKPLTVRGDGSAISTRLKAQTKPIIIKLENPGFYAHPDPAKKVHFFNADGRSSCRTAKMSKDWIEVSPDDVSDRLCANCKGSMNND